MHMLPQEKRNDHDHSETGRGETAESTASISCRGKADGDIDGEETSANTCLAQRWIQVLFLILGVALPLVAGSMISWPWGVGDVLDAEWVFWTIVVATCLLVFVGATLLRSPWALLVVSVAWIGGEFLGAVVRPLVEGGWPALQAEIHFWDAQGTIIPFGLLPVILCTLFGTALGMWLKERQQRR